MIYRRHCCAKQMRGEQPTGGPMVAVAADLSLNPSLCACLPSFNPAFSLSDCVPPSLATPPIALLHLAPQPIVPRDKVSRVVGFACICLRMADARDYTIGCICALPEPEGVALRAFLDEKHDPPEIPAAYASSSNRPIYVTGTMGRHKVAIATLPEGSYGIASATSVIDGLLSSYR